MITKEQFMPLIKEDNEELIIEALLNTSVDKLVTFSFVFGRNIIHLLVQANKKTVIDVLCGNPRFNELASQQDTQGNTVLHFAVREARYQELLLFLLKRFPTLLNTPNYKRQTPWSLAQDPLLKKTLMHNEYSQIEQIISLSPVPPNFEQLKKNLAENFPILFPGSNLIGAQESPMPRISLEEYQACAVKGDDFLSYCQKSPLKEDHFFELSQKEEKQTLVKGYIGQLKGCIHTVFDEFNQLYRCLLETFCHLFLELAEEDFLEGEQPSFEGDNSQHKKSFETIWALTICQPGLAGFALSHLAHAILGWQNMISFSQVLIYFRSFYPACNEGQKLVINFLFCQLLFYNQRAPIREEKLGLQLRLFSHCLENNASNFAKKAYESQVKGLISLYEKHQLLLNNHTTLMHWQEEWSECTQPKLFTEVVDEALRLTGDERMARVATLVSELRMISELFYRQVSIADFSQGTASEMISQQTNSTNKFIFYFAQKILSQPRHNIDNALRLMLQIAQAICHLRVLYAPDFNSLMIITGTLDHATISRLLDVASFTDAERELIKELGRFSTEKNYYWMRECIQHHQSPLPFLGALLQDLTFARDGNSEPQHKAELIGKILTSLFKTHRALAFKNIHLLTDLTSFLSSTTPPDIEEVLFYMSCRLLPYKPYAIRALGLNTLTNLEENCLPYHILPALQKDERSFAGQLVIQLLRFHDDYAASQLKTKIERREFRTRVQSIIYQIVMINNQWYFPQLTQERLNPMYAWSYLKKTAEGGVHQDGQAVKGRSKSSPTLFGSHQEKAWSKSKKTHSLEPDLTKSREESVGIGRPK